MHHLSVAERRNVLDKVLEEVKHFDFTIYFSSLNLYLTKREITLTTQVEDIILNESDNVVINEVLKGSPNKTVKEEIRNLFR